MRPASLPHARSAPGLLCWPWGSGRCPPASEKHRLRDAWGWQVPGQLPEPHVNPLELVGAATGLPYSGKVRWRGLGEVTKARALVSPPFKVGGHPAHPGAALSTGEERRAGPESSEPRAPPHPTLQRCSASAGAALTVVVDLSGDAGRQAPASGPPGAGSLPVLTVGLAGRGLNPTQQAQSPTAGGADNSRGTTGRRSTHTPPFRTRPAMWGFPVHWEGHAWALGRGRVGAEGGTVGGSWGRPSFLAA